MAPLTRFMSFSSRTNPVVVLVFTLSMAFSAQSNKPPQEIEAHFDSLESVVAEVAADAKTRSSNLKTTGAYFNEVMGEYPEFHDLLRINSKGIVTNEVARDGKVGAKYRSVARQNWFTEVVRKNAPYYGRVRTRQGAYLLFWAVPMTVKTRSGRERSVGALLAKIDLVAALNGAAQRAGAPLEIQYDGTNLLSHKWKSNIEASNSRIDVQGMEGLSVAYASSPKPASETITNQRPEQDASPAKAPSKTANAVKEVTETKEPSRSRLITTLVVAGSILLLLSILWAVFTRVAHTRRMKKIERELEAESSTESKTAPPPPPPPSGSLTNAGNEGLLSDAATVVMKRSDLPMDKPTEQFIPPAQQQYANPSFAPPASTPPLGASGSLQSPTAVPQTHPSTGISQRELFALKDEIRKEVVEEVRAQMAAQFQLFRREVKDEAEAFTSQAMVTLQDLIGRLSQSDGDPVNVITTVSNTMKELSSTIERYREK